MFDRPGEKKEKSNKYCKALLLLLRIGLKKIHILKDITSWPVWRRMITESNTSKVQMAYDEY